MKIKYRCYVLGQGGNNGRQKIIESMREIQEKLNAFSFLSKEFKESIMESAEKIMNESYEIGKKNPTEQPPPSSHTPESRSSQGEP